MFWGVTLETGKRYSQVVDSSYHLSMAALEPLPSEGSGSKYVSVMIEHNKSEFLLCTLEQNRKLQVALDHCFVEGEEVAYFLTGEGTVHLTGYIITDGVEGTEDSDDSEENEAISSASIRRLMKQNNKADEDSEDEDDEDWKPNAVPRHSSDFKKQIHGQELTNNSFTNEMKASKKQTLKGRTTKPEPEESLAKSPKKSSPKSLTQLKKGLASKAALDEESSDDEEDEDFLMGDVDEEEDSGEESDNDEENSDWEDTDDEDDEDDGEIATHQVKKAKLDESATKGKFSSNSRNNSSELSSTPQAIIKSQEKGSSKKKQKQNESSPQAKTPNQKNSLDISKSSSESTPHQSGGKPKKAYGGVETQDIIVGNGPVAKLGKMVHVYYRGTFPNKQEFDSCTKGKAFSFRLGKSEVIKGWDVGIQGMKVGGKRKLIIPPSMGYGNKVSGPIPPNSTLHFEVELKAVS